MMLKSKPANREFKRPPRGHADVSVSKPCLIVIIASSYCVKSAFLYYYNGAQKHEGSVGLEKPVPEQRLTPS